MIIMHKGDKEISVQMDQISLMEAGGWSKERAPVKPVVKSSPKKAAAKEVKEEATKVTSNK